MCVVREPNAFSVLLGWMKGYLGTLLPPAATGWKALTNENRP